MEINVLSALNFLGYGTVGTNICLELSKLGHNISLFPIGNIECLPENQSAVRQMLENAQLFNNEAPCVKIWHQFGFAERIGRGPFYGFPVFELTEFSPVEKNSLLSTDNLLVCSKWAKEVVYNNLPTYKDKVEVVPLGVNTNIFHPFIKNSRKTCIFGVFGKFECRKNHKEIIDIFNLSFERNDDVELYMVCNTILNEKHKQYAESIINYATSSKLGDKIKFLPHLDTHYDVARVMNQIDIGYFLSRAEGFDLPCLEVLACGKQVIGTNNTAHTEYLNDNNANLVTMTETEPSIDNIWFTNPNIYWHKLSKDNISQCVEYSRNFYKRKIEGDNLHNQAGVATAKKFTWTNSAHKLLEILCQKP